MNRKVGGYRQGWSISRITAPKHDLTELRGYTSEELTLNKSYPNNQAKLPKFKKWVRDLFGFLRENLRFQVLVLVNTKLITTTILTLELLVFNF